MKNRLKNYLTKKVLVSKIRSAAENLKNKDSEISAEMLEKVQVNLVSLKLGLDLINPEALLDIRVLSQMATAQSKDELREIQAKAAASRAVLGDGIPLMKTFINEMLGVCENKAGLEKVHKDLLHSLGVVLNQLGNAVENSESANISALDLLGRKLDRFPEDEEEEEYEEE